MKTEFTESKRGIYIKLIPETPKEMAQLLRITKNRKAEKPSIYASFHSDEPFCGIEISKVSESKQINSISGS